MDLRGTWFWPQRSSAGAGGVKSASSHTARPAAARLPRSPGEAACSTVASSASREGRLWGCDEGRPCGGVTGGSGSSRRRRAGPVCAAYRGKGSSSSSDPNYYELLGLDPDCDEEDIRTAFRRRAKELHPDVNKEDGATEAFVQLSRAYETLSDPEARRQYDLTNGTRRINFFRDVVEEEEEEEEEFRVRSSPFRWSQVGRRQSGLRPDDDGDDGRGEEQQQEDGNDEEEEEDEEGPGRRFRSQEEILEELSKYMSGGSLRDLQSGRLDPWGTSTSDTWFRQVERQTRNPYGPFRPGYGTSRDDDGGDHEWGPSRGVPGWTPPGRGSEWDHPRRRWDEEDRRGGGGGPGRQGGGGGGDFRQPFRI